MTSSRTAKVSKNITSSVVLQVTKIILSLISRIIFVKMLGATYLGINGLFGDVLNILSVADFGMISIMMYCLYVPLAKGDNEKIAVYINTFRKIYKVVSLIVLVLGLALIPFLRFIVNLPENVDNLYVYYVLMLLNVSIGYLFVYKTTLLRADQKGYLLDYIDVIAQVALFLAQTAFLILTKNYVVYLFLIIISNVLANLVKIRVVKKRYGGLDGNTNKLSKEERRALVEDIKGIFLYRIGGVIQSNTDNILISLFAGTIAVGYYSNYMLAVLAITSLVTMIFTSLKASIGNYNCEASIKKQHELFYIFEDYNFLLIGFCSICFYALLPDFINVCFGQEYLLDNITLICIVLNFYTSNIRQNIWVYRETTGLFFRVRYITLVTSTLNIVTSIVGGYYYGIAGIVGATVFSRMVYAWWKEPTILFGTYFKKESKRYFKMYISRLLYIIILSGIIGYLSDIIIINNMVLQTVCRIIFVVLMSSLALYLPFRKAESVKRIGSIIKSIRGGKGRCEK